MLRHKPLLFPADHWGCKVATCKQVANLSRNICVAPPVAVPDKIFGLSLFLDFINRCHSLRSLHPPPAALLSLPHGGMTVDLAVAIEEAMK